MTVERAAWQAMTGVADPLADRAVAAIVGPWTDAQGAEGPGLARLALATRLLGGWTSNGVLAAWTPPPGTDPLVAGALRAYLDAGTALPAWADPARIAAAEALFMAYGPMACTLLFCASLPECYALPHLAEVLQVSGQLEAHTEYRVRQTAAMVFPVMMKGGLTDPAGGGVAQVLKVRLIHATIRHLILRGAPEQARGTVPALAGAPPERRDLHRALLAHGWDVERQGLPVNQLELAYTLLTFHYVTLRGLRQLGLPVTHEQEEAFLHAWNVAGHVLGIHDELMPRDMAAAAALFDGIQAWGCPLVPTPPDARPGLGRALMDALAGAIRLPVLRGVPVPMARWLVGSRAADVVGIDARVGLASRFAFAAGRIGARGIDAVVRLVVPGFSLTRLFTRVVGYHLLARFLLDETRPLTLPQELLQPLRATIAGWHADPQAPGWMNRLEDRLTTSGPWRARA